MTIATTTQTAVSVRQFTEQEMRRYFTKAPVWPIPVAILGVLGILIGLSNTNSAGGCALVGVILVAVAGAVFYFTTQATKPTDAEYDAWVEDRVRRLEAAGLHKLNLDQSQLVSPPLSVRGIVLPTVENLTQFGINQVLWKPGKDGVTRFSINTGKYFFPTEHHLSAYSDVINAVSQNFHREGTEQFFYNDINGVTTGDKTIAIVVDKKNTNVQASASIKSFDLISSSGASTGASTVGVSSSFGGKQMVFQGGDRVDSTVNILRKLLNDKKGAGQQQQQQMQMQMQQQMMQQMVQMQQQMMQQQMGQGGTQGNPNTGGPTMPGSYPPSGPTTPGSYPPFPGQP